MTDEQLALACGLMIGALLNFIKAKRKEREMKVKLVEILQAAKEADACRDDVCITPYMYRFAAIIEKRTIERCAIAAEYALVPSFHQDEANCIGLTHRPTRAACAAAIRKLGEQ